MLVRSRSRNRARGGRSLSNALLTLASYGASDAWDFIADQYIRNGTVGPSGITFTRASVGSYLNNDNTMTVFSSGQPRIGDKGILIEGSRQNLFLNSAVGATQSITVTAAAHTLSFFGTGTVTLSGVSTDGPLVGTGEFNRVSLTFTPTAGSLTLTVSGDIKWVNLELGSFPTSWIPSDGTAVTRAADFVTAVPTTQSYPIFGFAEYELNALAGTEQGIISWDDGTSPNIGAYVNIATTDGQVYGDNGSTQFALNSTGVSANVIYKHAFRAATNDARAARNGTLTAQDSIVVAPTGLDNLTIGRRYWFYNTNHLFGYVRRIGLGPGTLTNAQLQEITT
jgi:hypothetical protein